MIYLLTPTGGRPEGLALLGEYLDAQTYDGPATWVIVDDCDPQTPLPVTRHVTQVIRPPWRWKDGENTQARSILAGVEVIPDDAVLFVVEDDDCYLPEYIETMLKALESADLVGESTARYYNVRTGKYKIMNTPHHSSLASTAMRGTAALAAACKARPKFIDVTLWRSFKGRKAWVKAQNVVGIKGLPGRAGIGVGHRDRFGSPDMSNVLEQWTGDYACNYRGYAK